MQNIKKHSQIIDIGLLVGGGRKKVIKIHHKILVANIFDTIVEQDKLEWIFLLPTFKRIPNSGA